MRAMRSVGRRLPIALAGAASFVSVLVFPLAASGEVEPNLLIQFADWGAYSAAPAGKKICFAVSKPTTQKIEPPGRKRDPAFLFVSNRPSESVRNEVVSE